MSRWGLRRAFAVLGLFFPVAFAQAPEETAADAVVSDSTTAREACEENPAVRYLQLIEMMNWEAMRERLAANARYLDPTMAHYDRPAIDLSGPEDIVAFWRSSSEASGTESIRYTYTHCFETAGFYIIRYELAVSASGAFWGLEQDRVLIPGQVTSVIQMAEGRVVEHRDYVDYAGADRFIEQLKDQGAG